MNPLNVWGARRAAARAEKHARSRSSIKRQALHNPRAQVAR